MSVTMKKTPNVQIDTARLQQLINSALEVLKKDRDRLVVAKRHGVAGEELATLESIGQQLGITRERVRQIEKAALSRIAESDATDTELSRAVTDVISQYGGLVAFDELLDQLQIPADNYPAVAFLVKLYPRVLYLSENDDHTTLVTDIKRYNPKDVSQRHAQLVEAARQLGRPVKFEHLLKSSELSDPTEAMEQLARVSKVLIDFESLWGLQSWPEVNPKSIRDKAYLVLKRVGRPMHFSEIAQAVTQLKPNAKQVTTQAVHNELIKDSRFVLIGRGIYALSQWGYKAGTVSDIIEEILREESPLTKDEIVRRVLTKRQVKPTTIVLNLQEKPQFERVGKATYKLKTHQT